MKVRYLREEEMQELAYDAAIAQGFDATQSQMLATCARNIYAIGCMYPPGTVTLTRDLRRAGGEGRGGRFCSYAASQARCHGCVQRMRPTYGWQPQKRRRAPPRVKPSCVQVGSTVRVRRSCEGMREDRRLA